MPNRFNFAFDYHIACWLAVLAYLPGLGCTGSLHVLYAPLRTLGE